MKKNYLFRIMSALLVISASAFVLSSCEKVKDLAEFDVPYTFPDVRFTVDSVDYLPKAEQLLVQETMTINVDSIIQANDLEGIEETKFVNVSLEIDSPSWVNFSWLSSARVTVSAQGLAETQVAAITSISPDGRTVDLQLSNTDVASTISVGSFVLKVYGNVNPPLPAGSINLLLKTKINMTVQPV